MKRVFLFLPLLLAACCVTEAAPAQIPSDSAPDFAARREARDVLAQLLKQQRGAQAFSLKFESRTIGADGSPLSGVKGSLLAADSGRFRLEHAGGTVVCDGKTLWQYFPANKQVIVKDASEGGQAGGVLLRFLQARMIRAEPENGGSLRIFLDPASVGQNLDSLILNVKADKPSIRSLETQDAAGNRAVYTVKSLRYDVRPVSGDFTFRVPSGVEVVDMR